jgi:flagellar hook assembly protein FlgD
MLGREVKTLVNSEQNTGIYNVQWNGDNNYGSKVSSGIYLYKIEAGNFMMTKKMILLK